MRQSNPIFTFKILTIDGAEYEKHLEELPRAISNITKQYADEGTGFDQNSDSTKTYVFIPARQIKRITVTLKRKGFGFKDASGPYYK